MKRILTALVAFATVGSVAFAEDAKPAGPAVSFEFSQQIDSEYINGRPSNANSPLEFFSDSAYSKTGVKATATYDLGNGLTVAPAINGSFEAKGAADTATGALGTVRFRNRVAPNVTIFQQIIPAFNVGLNLEYRIASDLKSAAPIPFGGDYIEQRVVPTLLVNGKYSIFDYSISQSFAYYLDSKGGDGNDDAYLDISGTYTIGTNLKINDDFTARISVSDTFEYEGISKAQEGLNYKGGIYNWANLKVALVNGGFTPYVGASLVHIQDKSAVAATLVNYAGGFVGAEFTKGTFSVNVKYDAGVDRDHSTKANLALEDSIDSHFSISLKIRG